MAIVLYDPLDNVSRSPFSEVVKAVECSKKTVAAPI